MNAWKGVNTPRFSVTTSALGSDCGFAFELGKRYLVYAPAEQGSREDLLLVTICTRTKLLEEAARDLAVLGEPEYIPAGDA